VEALHADVPDVESEDLAAVCNAPVGDLNPQATYDHQPSGFGTCGTKGQGWGALCFVVVRLYGKAGDDMLDESDEFAPVTAFGKSKVLAERDISRLSDDSFSPSYLRNATAYGVRRGCGSTWS
jgi:hypothetical protein